MALLVTGGRGFIGSHFVWAASAQGRQVVVLDNHSGGAPAPMPEGVVSVQGDIGDEALVERLVREHGVDACVNFAGKIQVGESVQKPADYFDVNVTRSLRLLDALLRGGVRRFVFSSTAAVYGVPPVVPIPERSPLSPVNPYGATKLTLEFALEAYGKAYGLRWAALRYFNAAGASPRGHLRENHEPETHLIPLVIDAALGRRPPLVVYGDDYPTPDGSCVRDYIHVDDLAAAHLRALDALGEGAALGPMNLGTGTGYSVLQVIRSAERLLGCPVPFRMGERRAGDPPQLVAAVDLAGERLGFRAQRSDLDSILEDTIRSRRLTFLPQRLTPGPEPSPMLSSSPHLPPHQNQHQHKRTNAAINSALAVSPAVDFTAPTPPLTRLANAGLLTLALGFSIALTVQLFLLPDLPAFLKNNTLAAAERRTLVISAVLSAVLTCVPPLLYLGMNRTIDALAKLERVTKIASPLLLAFPLPFFFSWRVFRDSELLCVLAASIWGLSLERSFRASFEAIGEPNFRRLTGGFEAVAPRLSKKLPAVCAGLMVAAFGLYFGYYTIQHHYNLLTTSWDLAIFDNMMWNLLRGKWFKASPDLGRVGSHIQYHATFDAFLFLPLYALRQRADMLLLIQAVFTGAAVIPLYLLARRRLQSGLYALVLCYAYCIHGPMHGPLFYDFHFLTMAPFFIGWVLWCFETNKKGWLIVAYIAAVLLREDQSATLATAALFYLLSGDRPLVALVGGLTSATLFVLLKFVIMPLHMVGAPKETFSWMYNGLIPSGEAGFGAVIRTLITNPIFVLKTLIVEEKFQYIMKMFAPVLFLSFRSPKTWVLHLAPMIFTLLSTGYSPLVQTYFQYTSNWTAYIFFGAAVTLSSWRGLPDAKHRVRGALAAIVVVSTALSYNHGAIFQHNTFRGGFVQVKFSHSDEDKKNLFDLYTIIALIPPKASVAATEHEAPHVSNREDCFTLRFSYDDADYLLVNIQEGRAGNTHENLKRALQTGQYGFIASRGKFALWGRGQPKDKNDEGARLVGLPATSAAPAPGTTVAPGTTTASPSSSASPFSTSTQPSVPARGPTP